MTLVTCPGNGVVTESHDGGVPEAPVSVLDVFLDERKHVIDDVILAALRHQHDAHARRLARIPLVVIVHFVLTIARQLMTSQDSPTCLVSVNVKIGIKYCRAPLA